MIRHMFKPIQIGKVEIPNRIVRTAHATNIGGGKIEDDFIAYHLERAKGGVGLSILESLTVDDDLSPARINPRSPDLIPSYQRLMAAVRPHGMRVFQQIYHGGHNKRPRDGRPPVSASDTPSPPGNLQDGLVPIGMTRDMISATIRAYADTCLRCEEGGLDGVEIHCAHSYLPAQFLSPAVNRRTDEYGGSLENRMRFGIELLRAVRERVGADFVVGIRLAPDGVRGGTGVEESIAFLERAQSEGLIDYVSASMGGHYRLDNVAGAMHQPTGYELPTSLPIMAARKVPGIVSGRFRTLEDADGVISREEADLVGMTRAHIADPYLVRKTREGRENEIRPCIGCNQGCLANQAVLGRLSCTVNVAVAEERTLSEDLIQVSDAPKRVLVVGGGPAGLEAARVAAMRGHNVVLTEASPILGGQVAISGQAPRHQSMGDIIDWQVREVYRLGVDVRMSTYMEPEDVRAENPDAVIVATGSLPRLDGFQSLAPGDTPAGFDRPNVVSSHDVIMNNVRPANGVAVVFDDLGHYEAVAAAEKLIEAGNQVIFVTSQIAFAFRLELALITTPALERLGKSQGQFRLLIRSKIVEILPDAVKIAPLYAEHDVETVPATLLVWVSPNRANRDLIDGLVDFNRPVIGVGDALAPRLLQTALREGHLAARSL